MQIFIGCSGFYYNHWRNLFYPAEIQKKDWLNFYSRYFNTVEINNTFYRMPSVSSVKHWHEVTPPGFIFSVKGYRYFTHLKRLVIDDDFKRYLNDFLHVAGSLREKSGPVLWQFPASFKANVSRLENFCNVLSNNFINVFEFRDTSWFSHDVYDILEKHDHTLCIISAPADVPGVIKNISRTAYVRFHGEGAWYRDNYSNEALSEWKNAIDNFTAETVYCYFNNDINGFAVNNARYLKSLYCL